MGPKNLPEILASAQILVERHGEEKQRNNLRQRLRTKKFIPEQGHKGPFSKGRGWGKKKQLDMIGGNGLLAREKNRYSNPAHSFESRGDYQKGEGGDPKGDRNDTEGRRIGPS